MQITSLRILTFTTLFPNQQQPTHGLFVKERIAALAKLAELRVVAPVPWFPRTQAFGERYYRYAKVPSREVWDGIPVDHPRFPAIPKVAKSIDGMLLAMGSLRHLRKVYGQFRFDVIDAHWAYPDGVAAMVLASRLGIPFSITVRGDDINVFFSEMWRRPWIRWALQRANGVIALSRELKEKVVAEGVDSEKVTIIRNGINPEMFHLLERAQARRHLALPDGVPILLTAGRLHASKGFPVLVEAVGRLAEKFPDLHLYILGAPDHEADATAEIRETAMKFNISGRVHLVGPQDPEKMKYWYGAADVFCLPTAREGSPNVILEAMACGLPCITTPVGGNLEIVDTPDVGLLVEANVESFTIAISDALSRTWDRAKISKLGTQRTWATVASECRDFLAAMRLQRK